MKCRAWLSFVFLMLTAAGVGVAAAEEALAYKLRPGKAFAYDVAIHWTSSGHQRRLVGQPLFQVHHTKKRKAVMMVIGRLRHESYVDGKWKREKINDYWFGTELTIDDRADRRSGMPGFGGGACPDSVPSLMSQQIFPELPHTDTDSIKEGGTTSTMELYFGNPFQKTTGKKFKGHASRNTFARPLGGGLVQLETRNKFARDDKSKKSSYRAQATFDNRLGLLLEKKVISKEFYSGSEYTVTAESRLIRNPDSLKAIKELAAKDYLELPARMRPLRFSRKRIPEIAHLPYRYSIDDLPKKGAVVAYYDKTYDEWYAVQFVGLLAGYGVEIRFLGTGETKKVHVGTMADPRRKQR